MSIRLGIFLVGLLLFLAGAASNFESIRMPIELKSITCSLGLVVFTLDVVFMIVGVFLILMAGVFHRLNQ